MVNRPINKVNATWELDGSSYGLQRIEITHNALSGNAFRRLDSGIRVQDEIPVTSAMAISLATQSSNGIIGASYELSSGSAVPSTPDS